MTDGWPTSDEIMYLNPELTRCYLCHQLFPLEEMSEHQADVKDNWVFLCEICEMKEDLR